jgi:hypothetical protein
MSDVDVIYLTLNRLPERFSAYQIETLKKTGVSIISVSRVPMDLGINLIDTDEPGYLNIYRQMLRAAKLSQKPYVAIAEDDVLYPPEHFSFYRPPLDTFAYNQNRLALFTWGEPLYHWRNRRSNATLIAPRLLMIEALEERFEKHGSNWNPAFIGELGRERVERGLGVTLRKSVDVFSSVSVIQFNHEHAQEERQRRKRKSYGPIRAYDIPYWGHASSLIKHYV